MSDWELTGNRITSSFKFYFLSKHTAEKIFHWKTCSLPSICQYSLILPPKRWTENFLFSLLKNELIKKSFGRKNKQASHQIITILGFQRLRISLKSLNIFESVLKAGEVYAEENEHFSLFLLDNKRRPSDSSSLCFLKGIPRSFTSPFRQHISYPSVFPRWSHKLVVLVLHTSE